MIGVFSVFMGMQELKDDFAECVCEASNEHSKQLREFYICYNRTVYCRHPYAGRGAVFFV